MSGQQFRTRPQFIAKLIGAALRNRIGSASDGGASEIPSVTK